MASGSMSQVLHSAHLVYLVQLESLVRAAFDSLDNQIFVGQGRPLDVLQARRFGRRLGRLVVSSWGRLRELQNGSGAKKVHLKAALVMRVSIQITRERAMSKRTTTTM